MSCVSYVMLKSTTSIVIQCHGSGFMSEFSGKVFQAMKKDTREIVAMKVSHDGMHVWRLVSNIIIRLWTTSLHFPQKSTNFRKCHYDVSALCSTAQTLNLPSPAWFKYVCKHSNWLHHDLGAVSQVAESIFVKIMIFQHRYYIIVTWYALMRFSCTHALPTASGCPDILVRLSIAISWTQWLQ